MAREFLTTRLIRSSVCPPDRDKIDLYDLSQRGFLVEIRRSGGKTYYQRYTDGHGREHQFKLGHADVLSLKEARSLGKRVAAEALIGTLFPHIRRQQLRTTPTLAEFVSSRYLPHIKTYKRSW